MPSDFLHATNGIISFIVALLIFETLYFYYKKNNYISSIGTGLLGIGYFALVGLSILWSTDLLKFSFSDYYLFKALIAVLTASLLPVVTYFENKNNKLTWLIGIYWIGLIAVWLISYHTIFIEILSYIFLFAIFLKSRNKLSGLILLYAMVSLILVGLNFLSDTLALFMFLPMLVLIFVFRNLLNMNEQKNKHANKRPFRSRSVKLIFYMFTINVFLLFGVVAIHELGHSIAADYYGCNHYTVISALSSPHTVVDCEGNYNLAVLALGGPVLSIVAILSLMFVSNKPRKYINYILLAVAIFISYGDLKTINSTENTIIVVNALAVVLLIIGLNKAVKIVHESFT